MRRQEAPRGRQEIVGNDIGSSCGEAIEPGEASGSVRYSTVPIRINGRGKYPQFAKFLRALREELPDTSVTDINLSGGGSTTAATSTLNLLWYAAPAPTVAKNETQ